jgi:hypothetical protein
MPLEWIEEIWLCTESLEHSLHVVRRDVIGGCIFVWHV